MEDNMPTADTEEEQATGRAQGTLLPNSHYSETTIKGDMGTVTDDCLLTQPVWQITAILAPSARH